MILIAMHMLHLDPTSWKANRHRDVLMFLNLLDIIILRDFMMHTIRHIRTGVYTEVKQVQHCKAVMCIISHTVSLYSRMLMSNAHHSVTVHAAGEHLTVNSV